MIILAYDIASDKTRTKFSKFLDQYGVRVQYSVYQIKNSKRILNNILTEIEHKYKKSFNKSDSIYIFRVCEGCQKRIIRYGSSIHEESDVVYFD